MAAQRPQLSGGQDLEHSGRKLWAVTCRGQGLQRKPLRLSLHLQSLWSLGKQLGECWLFQHDSCSDSVFPSLTSTSADHRWKIRSPSSLLGLDLQVDKGNKCMKTQDHQCMNSMRLLDTWKDSVLMEWPEVPVTPSFWTKSYAV